jgi:hypothetical protein
MLKRIPSSPKFTPLQDTTNTAPNPDTTSTTTTVQSSSITSPNPTSYPSDSWSQIDDFKWLKSTPSPNWSLLTSEDIITDDTWREVVPGGPGWSLDDILKAVRVLN